MRFLLIGLHTFTLKFEVILQSPQGIIGKKGHFEIFAGKFEVPL